VRTDIGKKKEKEDEGEKIPTKKNSQGGKIEEWVPPPVKGNDQMSAGRPTDV